MRIHKLLATVLAAGLVFSGCHQDEDYLLPDIEINAESLDFSDDTELKISLTASRDWLVRSKPDWVAVDPDHGSASSAPQRVVMLPRFWWRGIESADYQQERKTRVAILATRVFTYA